MYPLYSPKTVDFLWGIRLNNNREWFLQNKQQYIDTLYEPTKALGKALFEPFLAKSGTVLKVSRIYRDARRHHPTPYKESLWISIRPDKPWWAENPCLFFEISPEGIRYGFCLWHPKADFMEAFRKKLEADPETLPKLLKNAEKATGIPVTADCYKRPKATENPALAPYFAWKEHICCIRSAPFSPVVFSPELAQEVKEMLCALAPLYDYFTDISL